MDKVDIICQPSELKPRVVLASYYVLKAPYRAFFRVPGTFFILVTGGRFRHHLGTPQEGLATSGELVTFDAGRHTYEVVGRRPFCSYMFNVLLTGERDRRVILEEPMLGRLPTCFNVGDQAGPMARQVERCMQQLVRPTPGWELTTAAAILQFLFLAYQALAGKSTARPEPIDRWKTLLHRLNASPDDTTVAELAAEMDFSVEHFIRRFKAVTGTTPKHYVQEQRLLRARLLLQEGARVKEAALAVGYRDSLYFSRCFRQKFGYPPSRTRELDNALAALDEPMGLPLSSHLLAPDVDASWFRQ